MGVFDDKEYDKMDWISQAVEPIKSPLNELLSALPDEYEITYARYNSLKDHSYSLSINASDVLKQLSDDINTLTYDETHIIQDCYEFQVENGTEVDFEKKEIRGNIKLIKIRHQLDDKELTKNLGNKGKSHMSDQFRYADESNMTRLNDVLEILDCNNEARRTRSLRKKCKAIRFIVDDIMTNNKWNIKNSDLADKVGYWIGDYIRDGSMPSFANLCRLKLMTHKGLPIYSMAEDKT